ncbi:AI-2E family transporter [Cellulosilyticum ruminicola]|uniref:AI-2E family transporter n=1 Tax=Cellulosilyticum ruminicola TaxID=425254 RepID=UPI0006D00CD3|nr:AI-2E family transporter [Cellulosilyticum ruminicola]
MTNETFKGFIVGQLTDALIVGILTFIGAWSFRFPYPLLIGFIAGITNVIPVLGPFIGAVPCVIIILLADPTKVIWYLVFVVVLQQIDGNIICPKVVGDSIGLDGIWVVFVVLVGGGLFGIIGSVLGVPVFAIIFRLYNEWLAKRLEAKKIKK